MAATHDYFIKLSRAQLWLPDGMKQIDTSQQKPQKRELKKDWSENGNENVK